MNAKYLLSICFSLLIIQGFSQNGLPSTYGAKSIAMGNTGVSRGDIHALLNNQAGLANITSFSAIIAAEQRFAISELRTVAAGVVLPTDGGTFGLNLQYFGVDLYNEQRVGLSFSRRLFDHLAIGIQVGVHTTRIEEYGSHWVPTAEAGILYQITSQLSFGLHLLNPVRIKIIEGEFLPTVMRLGFSYQSSDKASFAVEINKDIEYPLQVRAGIEYQLADPFFIRIGIQTAPEIWSFGLGYILEKQQLAFDLSAANHPFLGYTPAISLAYPSQ